MVNGGLGSPTPKGLYPAGGSSVLGMTFGSSNLNPNAHRRQPSGPTKADIDGQQQQQPQSHRISGTVTAEDEEGLRKYQEACLKRETPMLRLMARPKSRAPSGSTATSPQTGYAGGGLSAVSDTASTTSGDMDMGVSPQLRGVGTLGTFAAPYPPEPKQGGHGHARSWSVQFQRPTDPPSSLAVGRSASMAEPPAAAGSSPTSRPSYKRLPSQTLGPENSKKQHFGEASPPPNGDGGERVSMPEPGYGATGGGGGGGPVTWTRQRSLSSPSSLRTFDWQSIAPVAAPAAGGNAGVGRG